jgi:hypothetical protein
MLYETADIDEFGKVDVNVDKQYDPNFPMRRIAGLEVAHDAAYAWWSSVEGKGFVHWYEEAETAFKSGKVSKILREKAKETEKWFSELPSIAKLVEGFNALDNKGRISWEKLGKAAYVKSQFKPLRTPEERVAKAAVREAKASKYRERDVSLRAGQTGQRPPFPTGRTITLPYSTPEPSGTGTQQPAPTQEAPTSSSQTLDDVAQATSSHPTQQSDVQMNNPEENPPGQ